MVRVKYRYILAEIWCEKYNNKIRLPLKEIELQQAIYDSVEMLHGDYGVACIQSGFSIKMYNAATRVFVARVHRKFHSVLSSALPFVTSIGKMKLSIRTLRLSGTIRSAFKFLIQFDKEKLIEISRSHQLPADKQNELAEMIKKCHTRLAKRRFDVE